MKNLKMLYIALIALVAGAFGACTNEFEPGPQMTGPQVSFMDKTVNPTLVEFTGAAEENTQKLTLTRVETKEALDVWVLAEIEKGAEKFFNIPETVSFAAGESTAELVYTVNQEWLENDKEYTVNFVIADEMESTPYGHSEWTVKYALNPWELMKDANDNPAKGKFRGMDLVYLYEDIDPMVEVPVNIYKHKSQKGLYRVENPWMLSAIEIFEGEDKMKEAGVSATPTDLLLDCSNPAKVVIAEQSTGLVWDPAYGELCIYPMTTATLVEGVITLPTKGSAVYESLYPNDLYYGNPNGLFRIVLPGYEAVNYSLAVAYDGMDISADNKVSIKFKFSYGADVTGIKYMFVNSDVTNDPSEALETLFAGEDKNILSVENFVKDGKEVGIKAELEAGEWSIVAAPMDKDGVLRSKEAIVYYRYISAIGDTEKHPCEIEVLTKKMSECTDIFGEEIVAKCPDYSSFAYCFVGKDIKSLKYLRAENNTVQQLVAQGATLEQLIDEYGDEIPAQYMEYINSEDGLADYLDGVDANTEYIVAVLAVNKYSEKAVASAIHTTDPIPYSGSLVLGQYEMNCVWYAGTENEWPSKNIFKVENILGSVDEFFVSKFAIEDSLKWYAKYDETASTLTLSGLTLGNEALGALFGKCYGFYNAEQTMMYGIDSYGSAESQKGVDPVVLKVDPTTKQICGLPTGAEIWVTVYDVTSGSPKAIGSHAAFNDTTTIAPYVPAAGGEPETASVKSVDTPSVNTLMRNIRKAEKVNIATSKIQRATLGNIAAAANFSKNTLRTVKPSLVEQYTPAKAQGFKLKTNAAAIRR